MQRRGLATAALGIGLLFTTIAFTFLGGFFVAIFTRPVAEGVVILLSVASLVLIAVGVGQTLYGSFRRETRSN